jgi:transcriptional regulator with PAS, ATPase and Fis domain
VTAQAEPGLDPIALAKALARGEDAGALLAKLPEGLREIAAALVRACGGRILELEAREARLESSLVDLRMALKSYSQSKRKLREDCEALRAELDPARRPIIGAEAGLREVMRLAAKVVDTPISVLITGESGTGKEIVARHIHDAGARSAGPFVAINCAAIPEPLLESELFGIAKGVATGVGGRAGKFEDASGGTIFLDEVADMPLTMQVKILRALQEREVVPVGGRAPVPIDVRVISATNKVLEAEIAARRFREDLYFRLVGVHIPLPPLRERGADIEALLERVLADTSRRFRRSVHGFSPEALAALRAYRWPGNVRELIVEVERAVALADGDRVELADLTPRIAAAAAAPARVTTAAGAALGAEDATTFREARLRFERDFLGRAFERFGSLRRTAKMLGLSREGLRKKLVALGLKGAAGEAGEKE